MSNSHSHPTPPNGRKRRIGLSRFSVVEFLVALAVLLVAAPFVELLENGELVETVLMTVVLVSGVLAVGKDHRVLWLAVGLVSPAIFSKWLNHLCPDSGWLVLFLASGLVFIVFLIFQLLRFILNAPRVNAEILCAGISSYLLLGLLWAFAYMLVAGLVPGAFVFSVGPEASHVMTGFTSLYFSYITLSTVGYGDITPVADVARMLAALEAMTGTLFVAVLIARLVSMYSSTTARVSEKSGEV